MNFLVKLIFRIIFCTIGLIAALGAAPSFAKPITTYADDYWLDWKEEDVSNIPDFNIDKAIFVEVDVHSQLDWYVDPKTITIGKDGVVRYVIFAKSASGTVNAMYEGISCAQGTYKIYARSINHANQSEIEWRLVENTEWKNLDQAPAYSHERIMARDYMCDGNSRPNNVRSIASKLHRPFQAARGTH